jgi:hypothetical protein
MKGFQISSLAIKKFLTYCITTIYPQNVSNDANADCPSYDLVSIKV